MRTRRILAFAFWEFRRILLAISGDWLLDFRAEVRSQEWRLEREIEISIDCGTVSLFKNYAIVSRAGSNPVRFHAKLLDGCNRGSSDDRIGELRLLPPEMPTAQTYMLAA
jgi:hypothetical protein